MSEMKHGYEFLSHVQSYWMSVSILHMTLKISYWIYKTPKREFSSKQVIFSFNGLCWRKREEKKKIIWMKTSISKQEAKNCFPLLKSYFRLFIWLVGCTLYSTPFEVPDLDYSLCNRWNLPPFCFRVKPSKQYETRHSRFPPTCSRLNVISKKASLSAIFTITFWLAVSPQWAQIIKTGTQTG